MKHTKQFLFICLSFAVLSVQAALPPQLEAPLDNLTIYSGAAITMGAISNVSGNIQAEAAATLCSGSNVSASNQVVAGTAHCGGSIVSGYIVSGGAVVLGEYTHVGDYIVAREDGTIGADSTIVGNLTIGVSATLGATTIDGDIMVGGDLTAGTTIVIGAKAVVAGNARAGTSVTLAEGATVVGSIIENSKQEFENDRKEPIDDQSPQLLQLQADLAAMEAPTANQLPATITENTTFKKGIYHTTDITTSVGITITFDGEGEDGHWLINSDSFIAFGANTKMVLKDVTPNSTITWNAGSYANSGEGAELLGTFFAGSYISTGQNTILKGIGDACGGMFTSAGAVTLGVRNIIGTTGCKVQPPTVHHYEIVHDGQGLTCEPESVEIRACADASCSALNTQPITLDFLTDDELISSETFTGSTTASFSNTVVETLTFSLANTSITATNPLVCDDSSGNSCNMGFTNAGLRFLSGAGNSTTLPNQTAGSSFSDTLKVQAVEDTDGVCTALFSGSNNVYLSQENVEPGGTSGLSFASDGATIAKHSGSTNITLSFDADSIAVIPTPVYHDAGKIRLHASYAADGVILSGSSNSFWVSPAELVIIAKSGLTNLSGATVTATSTHEAGNNFNLSVTALNSLGVITPNYSQGQIQLMLTRTGPTLTDSVDGNLSYGAASTLASSASPVFQNVNLTHFSSGVSIYTAAQYSEVGLLDLDVQDSNYGDANIIISAVAINIGRFIPDHFTQTVADDGFFLAKCNTAITFAAYNGQKDEATNSVGAISYLTNPVLVITAFNKQGNITQNYHQDSQGSVNDYMKLSSADIIVFTPTLDQVAMGIDSNKLPLTANMNTGTLSENNLTSLSSGGALPKGVLHYQLSDSDNFFYNRSANALVAPFTSDINFSIATIIDADNVGVTTTVDASPTGVEIRFGRLLLKNSFGPETANFPQPMQIEYFNGSEFSASADNNCASYDAGRFSLTNISLDPVLTNLLGGTGYFLTGKTQEIELQAPGAGNQGQLLVSYDTYDWFKYDWDNDNMHDDSPSAIATFGIFRGNDRMGYSREVFYR